MTHNLHSNEPCGGSSCAVCHPMRSMPMLFYYRRHLNTTTLPSNYNERSTAYPNFPLSFRVEGNTGATNIAHSNVPQSKDKPRGWSQHYLGGQGWIVGIPDTATARTSSADCSRPVRLPHIFVDCIRFTGADVSVYVFVEDLASLHWAVVCLRNIPEGRKTHDLV